MLIWRARQGKIAREVADKSERTVIVAGSLPPPHGSYRPNSFEVVDGKKVYNDLIQAQAPYVDVWIAETLASSQEFAAVHDVLKASEKPKYYAFTLQDDSELPRLRSGELVGDVAEALYTMGADGMLFNCSIPEMIAEAIKVTKAVFDKHQADIRIGAYANSFEPIKKEHEASPNELTPSREFTPEDYLSFAKQWHAMGASIIGGCCGIRPDHIETLSQWKNSML